MALRLKPKRTISKHTATAQPPLKRMLRFLYKTSYFTGKAALRLFNRIKNGFNAVFEIALAELFSSIKVLIRNITEYNRARAIRGDISVTRGIINLGRNFGNLFRISREAIARGGLLNGLAVAGRIIKRGVSKSFASKKSALNFIAPAAAIFVLILTIYFWSNATFALSVSYGGKELGIVASEQTFRNAADEVEEDVSDASGSSFALDGKVTMKLVLAKKSDLLNEEQMYNNIILKSCEGVKNGYGLYIDNRLAGVNAESGAIEAMLNDMTKEYKKDPDVQSVDFNQDVQIKSGLFPESVFKSIDEIKKTVTGDDTGSVSDNTALVKADSGVFRISLDPLYAMNLSDGNGLSDTDSIVTESSTPKLSVKVVKNEVYERQIPYQTEQTTSDKIKSGKTVIRTYGQNGVQRIVAAVSYVDGVKVGEEIISTTITKQPVNQKVVVGTKKKKNSRSYYGGSFSYDDVGGYDSSSASRVLKYARSAIGVPYVYGGTSRSGFDCSGFTAYVYSKVGKKLPHSAAAQSAYGSYVSRSNLKAGDLVFFDTNGGHNSISHVGIYIGGGKFIDASSSRPHAVTIDSLNSSYYSKRYMTARRILK